MLHWLAIVVLSVLSAISYGIIHDQVTARICVEYFTIGHPVVIRSEDPTLLAFAWGIIATWWVGVGLGIPLACFARLGSRPPLEVGDLFRPMFALLAGTGVFAAICGGLAYVAASNDWIRLTGPMAKRVPLDRHVLFLTDFWTHNASYLGATLGGISLMIWAWRTRGRIRRSPVPGS